MPERFLPGAVQRPAREDAGPCAGNLPRVVWHSTETDPATTTAAAIANNLDRENWSVHLVWHPVSGAIVQAIPADRYGRGLIGLGFPTNTMGNPGAEFAARPAVPMGYPHSSL